MLRRQTAAIAVTIAFGAVLTSRVAHADPPADPTARLPLPETQRPVTLPRLILSPEAGFQVDHRAEGTYGEVDVSAAYGITDDLMVHALVLPLQLWGPGQQAQYGETNRNFGPAAGVTYRFLRGRVELAADLTGRVFTIPNLSGASVTPSVIFRAHATDLRLDIAPAVTLQFATQHGTDATVPTGTPVAFATSGNRVGVSVPLSVVGDFTPSFSVAVDTGLTIYDTSDTKNSTGIPAGIVVGYAVPGPHGPLLDVKPFFDFPYFVMPGRAQLTNTNQYQVGLNVVGYIYL